MSEATAPGGQPPPLPVIAMARRRHRLVAAVLDFSVIVLFTMFLLFRILWPKHYPEEFATYMDPATQQAMSEWGAAILSGEQPSDKFDLNAFAEMFAYGTVILMIAVWIYFFASEAYLKGGSLGKAAFGLRVVSLRTGGPPGMLESSLRAMTKSICLLSPMLLLIPNLLCLAFTAQKRAGHDYIARTIVVAGTTPVIHSEAADSQQSS